MNSKIKIVVVILILAILPVGCLVGPKYKKPEDQNAANFRNGSTNVDTLASVVRKMV